MAVVDLSKVMNLADAQEIYKDLRDRIKNAGTVKDVKVDGVSVLDENDVAIIVLPTVPVTDVQLNGTSILSSGIANIPVAGPNQLGVLKVGDGSRGVNISQLDNELQISFATANTIKTGVNSYCPVTPKYADAAAFYGLAKAAGKTMSSVSGATVGVYPDEQKQAIQKMLGLDGLFGDYQNGNTASKAYAVGETFIMDGKRYKVTAAISDGGLITVGTNCELDPLDRHFVKTNEIGPGLIWHNNSMIIVNSASTSQIKAGTSSNLPITPLYIPDAVFYGLSRLAGVDLKNSDTPIGTYTAEAKAAIQSMLGVSTGAILIENVSGGTPTLTCLPNVRYKCGEVSTLSITPPASGSCEVIFESGSTATLLTVPNTVKFPPWFDATALETGTIYDIIITDGVYGAVMSWAS